MERHRRRVQPVALGGDRRPARGAFLRLRVQVEDSAALVAMRAPAAMSERN
jgi:hypothetical protein